MTNSQLSPEEAAQELLIRRRARTSILDYVNAIDIPGKPATDDPDEEFFLPAETTVADHHRLLLEKLDEVSKTPHGRMMVFMPPGSAKALTLDTPIPTPTGWTTMGELRIGDSVFDESGKPCKVTWVSPIHRCRPIYRVTTDCGDQIMADKDHEWLVRLCGKPRRALKANGKGRPPMVNRDELGTRFKIKETWELAKQRSKRPMIAHAKTLELPDVPLPIDPYLLGVWLGDGNSDGLRITSSVEDQPWLRRELERLGYVTSDSSVPTLFGVLGIRGEFVKLGLVNAPRHGTHGRKHVPSMYMRSSAAQRLALLQGLIDTDGTVCKKRGCTTFCNTNKALAEAVRELARSLGVKAGWSEGRAMLYEKDCGAVYRVSFYMKDSARMPRKADLCRDQVRTPDTYIDVEEVGIADTVCIEVDSPSHLFLCGRSMTPTHNSTYASVVFPSRFLGEMPNRKVILASYGDDLARKMGRRTRQIVRGKRFKGIWDCELSAESSAADEWSLTNGSEYMACGILGGITGNRAHGIIIDDPIKGREQAESETIRQKTWDAYEDDLKTRLIPGGWIVIIQTRWHEDDLSGRILPDGWDGQSGKIKCKDGNEWEVICLQAQCERDDDPLGRAMGEYLWPEWFDERHWEQFKSNPRTWYALFQQKPRPSDGGEFRREWIHHYQDVRGGAGMNKIMLIDPASGKRKNNDYTSIWVIGLASDGNHYALDMVRDKMNLAERANKVMQLHRKWRPYDVRYERYGMMADIEHLQTVMEKEQYRFKVTEVGGSLSKEDRIRRILPVFQNHQFYLPQTHWYTRSDGKVYDLVHEFINEEYLAFPVGRHDDMMDGLSRMAEPGKEFELKWPNKQYDAPRVPEFHGGGGGMGLLG